MGLFTKLTNPLNHGQDLQDLIDEYNQRIKNLQNDQMQLERDAFRLYEKRKDALKALQALKYYTENLQGCPKSVISGANRAVQFADAIRDAWDFENAHPKANDETGSFASVAMAGAAVGGAGMAVGGSTALMAIATTFGTAGTGTAISTLGGAAAANAALAWLGGGTIAAGGAGIAGGTALLSALGPIGWTIGVGAGVALVAKSVFDKKKNEEKIREVNAKLRKCAASHREMKKLKNQVDEIFQRTDLLINKIDITRFHRFVSDFASDTYPHSLLFETVSDAKNLGKLTKQSVNLK